MIIINRLPYKQIKGMVRSSTRRDFPYMCKVGVIRGQQPWHFPKSSLSNFLFKTRPQFSTTDVFLLVLVLTTGCFRSPIRYVYRVNEKNKHSGPTVNPTPNFRTRKNLENYWKTMTFVSNSKRAIRCWCVGARGGWRFLLIT